jgi:hypothetical protein
MAYCIFSVDVEKISIENWGIINMLMDEEDSLANVKTCNVMMDGKTKKQPKRVCGKKCVFTSPDETQQFCSLHSKKCADFIFPQKEFMRPHIKKYDMVQLKKKYDEIFVDSREDLGKNSHSSPIKMKKQDYIDSLAQYYESKCFKPVVVSKPKKRANDMDLISIGRIMKRKLDDLGEFNQVTHVIMENQISPLASRMKTVQGMLTQYFIHKESSSQPITIEYVSSANKLKGFTVDAEAENTYKQHKKDGIVVCGKFLEMNFGEDSREDWIGKLASSSKKDDLADSFLQGIWYLKHNNIISYAEDLKIKII